MSDQAIYARPYAKALFDLAQSHQSINAWQEVLAKLAAIANDPVISKLLANPACNQKQFVEVVLESADQSLTKEQANLLKLLAEKKRLSMLPDLYKAFVALANAVSGKVQANLYSAIPLAEAVQQEILKKLEHRLQKKVELQVAVDHDLIGGVQIHVGDYVIDASVRGALQRLASELLV